MKVSQAVAEIAPARWRQKGPVHDGGGVEGGGVRLLGDVQVEGAVREVVHSAGLGIRRVLVQQLQHRVKTYC
jgi:hypothetical protein